MCCICLEAKKLSLKESFNLIAFAMEVSYSECLDKLLGELALGSGSGVDALDYETEMLSKEV